MRKDNVLLAITNLIQTATLAPLGAAWIEDGDVSLANLQQQPLSREARTSGLDPVDTGLVADFGGERWVNVVALCGHNLTAAATWSVELWGPDGVGVGQPVYSAPDLAVWPAMFPAGGPGAITAWDCTDADLAEYDKPWHAAHVLPEAVQAQHLVVRLDDQTNPAGHLTMGEAWAAAGWQPPAPMLKGATPGVRDDTPKQQTLGGVTYAAGLPLIARTWSFELARIGHDEAWARLGDMARRAGTTRRVLVVGQPADPVAAVRGTWPGHFDAPAGMTLSEWIFATGSFTMTEAF